MALESTQPLTEMSTRNLPRDKERPARMADNLTDCLKIWEPRRLTTLWASTACYRDSFTFLPAWSIAAARGTEEWEAEKPGRDGKGLAH
jgi:hypothetical protein